MLKWIKKIFLTVGALLVVLLPAGYIARCKLLELGLSSLLQVPVQVSEMDLSLHQIVLRGLEVENFSGSKIGKAFSCPKIEVDFSLSKLLSNPCTLDRLSLEKPMLAIEFYSDGSSNWGRFSQQLKGKSTKEESSQKKQRQDGNKQVYNLDRFYCHRADLSAYNPKLSKEIIRYPVKETIELTNLSSEASTTDIATFVLEGFLQSMGAHSLIDNLLEDTIDKPKKMIDSVLDKFKEGFKAVSGDDK